MSTNTTSSNQSCSTTIEVPKDEYEQLIETVERLETELQETRKEQAQDRQRIHDLEERLDAVEKDVSDSSNPTPETETDASTTAQTPIEDVIRIPEHLVEDSLTANQQRSRAVAKDIHQYSRSVPAGRAIKSSELRRVLSAQSDGGPAHTETVSRVMTMLDDLGKESINMRTSQSGEKVVVFDEDLVKRIVAHQNNHDVVADATGGAGAET
jgi:hypothetical protein